MYGGVRYLEVQSSSWPKLISVCFRIAYSLLYVIPIRLYLGTTAVPVGQGFGKGWGRVGALSLQSRRLSASLPYRRGSETATYNHNIERRK